MGNAPPGKTGHDYPIRKPSTQDESSLSNPNDALIRHLDWVANVDFTECILKATATYKVVLFSSKVSVLKLDTKYLNISSVKVNNEPISTYTLSPLNPLKEHLGQCLTIPLLTLPSTPNESPSSDKETYQQVKVSIVYQTTPKSSALQWLPPSQTAGKIYPYLFTQCQAIHARSLLPCQDCPGVKMTYTAQITTPSWATCVMSALSDDTKNQQQSSDDKNIKTYFFHQPVPISAYLVAMAVGELESRVLSPRVKIWSEPSVLPACAKEFANTETFLKTAESLTFEYVWGRYDLLCLPPSFPYGGMENPCLTFVTPTLLAGDQSLVDVVAHEIAHSWTGNLVTNATWEHFWLNEGWTTWLQRKIMVEIKRDRKFMDFDAIGGWKDLCDCMEVQPDAFTSLIPKLDDLDPDEAFSTVPYEKGFCLLYTLESIVGIEQFEEFTKAYLQKFKFTTVTSYEFRDFCMQHFKTNENIQVFDWEAWLHTPGLPPTKPNFDQTLAAKSIDLADSWIAADISITSSIFEDKYDFPSVMIDKWTTNQITCFLDSLLSQCGTRKKSLDIITVKEMKEKYGMAESHNAEILSRFCQLAIQAGDKGMLPITIRFITTQGRMKFVRPLYRILYQSEMGKELAIETFLEHQDFYHPIASKMIAVDLGVSLNSKTNKFVRESIDTETKEDEDHRKVGDIVKREGMVEKQKEETKVARKTINSRFLIGFCVSFIASVSIALFQRRKR